MIEISNTILPDELIVRAARNAYFIALRNRCKYTQVRIKCISGDIDVVRKYMGASVNVDHDTTLGCCFFYGYTRGIYLKPGRNVHDTVRTLCHELAHAYTNPTVKHSYSWRSLYLLYYATLPRLFNIHSTGQDLYKEIVETLYRYEVRGATPYDRHLNAMLRMRKWYIDRVEGEVTT